CVVPAAESGPAPATPIFPTPPLAAGPGVEPVDLVLVPSWPPPLREKLGVGVRLEHELARCVEDRRRDDLLLSRLDRVFSLGHRLGSLFRHFSSSPLVLDPAKRR